MAKKSTVDLSALDIDHDPVPDPVDTLGTEGVKDMPWWQADHLPDILLKGLDSSLLKGKKKQHISDALRRVHNRKRIIIVTPERSTEIAHVLERLATLMEEKEPYAVRNT